MLVELNDAIEFAFELTDRERTSRVGPGFALMISD